MPRERLDKLIASQKSMSRKEVHKAMKDGAVKVNSEVVKDPSVQVDGDSDEILLFGKPLKVKRFVYIMMDKPKGVLSAANDKKVKTVVDLLPEELKRRNLFPAGRLDKDTTGFILITDDGDFAHRILAPKSHIEKTYEALLSRSVTNEDIKAFSDGITLEDGTQLMPAKLCALDSCRAQIKICEGKFHQIKRMFAATGNEVLELRRTAMGALELDETLSEGAAREITSDELKKIIGE